MENCSVERNIGKRNSQSGAVVIMMGVFMSAVFLGLAALAIDVAYFYSVRNELQNAADTAALTGAKELYHNRQTDSTSSDWGLVDTQRNEEATNMVVLHSAAGSPVVLDSVSRGHWTFSAGGFGAFAPCQGGSCGESTRCDLSRSLNELNGDSNFVNAMQVTTRATATTLFSHSLIGDTHTFTATAVAYIGFAGSLHPREVTRPLAVCMNRLQLAGSSYDGTTVRMISGGETPDLTNSSGVWVDYNHPNVTGTPSDELDEQIRDLVCTDPDNPENNGNTSAINLGSRFDTRDRSLQDSIIKLRDCFWKVDDNDVSTKPTKPWRQNVLVVDCPDGASPGGIHEMKGLVAINIIWVSSCDGSDPACLDHPKCDERPSQMEAVGPYSAWSCSTGSTPDQCWNQFAQHFQPKKAHGQLELGYQFNTIYYIPESRASDSAGMSGGTNFGVVARMPVLVK